ncbi:Dipeptide transport system permease protein DppB (TC 3.A.1.5.2) [Actinomycetales bacterium JB111]|nr:Dipeptide transport system permease protein DppB (TC 3.A.1.5.2) [Actinomycetales bacterium JB111]
MSATELIAAGNAPAPDADHGPGAPASAGPGEPSGPGGPAAAGRPARRRGGWYVLRRLGEGVLVLWGTFTLAFALLQRLPGDAVSIRLGGEGATLSTEEIARIRAEMGYDDPFLVRYWRDLVDLVQGDLGHSLFSGEPVVSAITRVVPHTAFIALVAVLLGGAVGLVLGSVAATTRSRRLRCVVLALPPLGVSIPTFAVALVLIQVVAFSWRLLPSSGNDGLAAAILPILTLSLPVIATVTQIFTRSLDSVLAQGYVATAVTKGAGRRRVLLAHGLRNAAGPTLTVAGLIAGNLLAGAIVTETVFAREGLGRLTVTAVTQRDMPLLQGIVLFAALVFVVINILVDLAYPLLDRRVRLEGERRW